ncbi:MAG: hypothetical protein ACHQHO_08845 [Solirubrobacterales bacterium]
MRSHDQVRLLASEAAPRSVARTPSGTGVGAPGSSSVTLTDGASAPWTDRAMQPVVAVEAESVNGPPSLAGVGGSEEQGALTARPIDAPAASVTLNARAIATNVAPQACRMPDGRLWVAEPTLLFTFLLGSLWSQ